MCQPERVKDQRRGFVARIAGAVPIVEPGAREAPRRPIASSPEV
jgi:hypothetical protein